MELDTRARKLQVSLLELGVRASLQECKDMLVADFVERILAQGVDAVLA